VAFRKHQLWKDENAEMHKDVTKFVTNPLNAYLMIKRQTADLAMMSERVTDVVNEFKDRASKVVPDAEDLEGAVEGLLRLQTTYKLQSSDLVN